MPDGFGQLSPARRSGGTRVMIRVTVIRGPGDDRALDDLATVVRELLDQAADRAAQHPPLDPR